MILFSFCSGCYDISMSMTPSRRTLEAMTLGGMAADNRTLTVRCYHCRRTSTFLAADLVKVYGENQSPHTLFRTCSKCGSGVRVGFGFPRTGEIIRRPVVATRWQWKDERYEG